MSNPDQRVTDAAKWLHDLSESRPDPLIPALKERFGLTNMEAIEAAKRAHALQYGRAV